ncbi:ABC transporter substrate-binding protein [Xanthobacter dioxanivorans]|uniref:Thiamine pyrimidine synthase n=2 Tax=Xanthobacter dioxanivorans TaxID=2528964 RepID=A0A974PMB2_9HYPH|nr:ABC transporter substrate-binding protein [Xanthobacter dioxanivorans]
MLMISTASAAETIRVRLDWTPWGNQAPFHLAAKKGLFAANGLDVEIVDGNGSVATVQIVGNGEFDVGHASLAPMAIARAKGLPVKAIAGFVRQNDIGLLVPKDSGITKPADLKGKKLAFTAGSLEAPFLDRFLAAGNLTRADVDLIAVDAAAKGGTYMMGRADGVFSTVPFILPLVSAQRPSSVIRFADYGLTFPSFGLFATEKSIAAKGPALKAFSSIVAGTWTYILDGHEDEAVQAIIDARPQAKLNPAVLRTQIETLKGFVATPATNGKPMGVMAQADWAEALSVLADGGLVPAGQDAAAYFTNDLIDPALVARAAAGGR